MQHFAFVHKKIFELTEVTPDHLQASTGKMWEETEDGGKAEQSNSVEEVMVGERAEEPAANGKDANSDEEVESGDKSQEEEVEQEILEKAFGRASNNSSSEIESSDTKCQGNRSGAGCEGVLASSSDGRRKQKKKRKLFSETGIGPQILE